MKYEAIKKHPFRVEITKEEVENAMLVPGEYIVDGGKYYTIPGMLDGYMEPEPSDFDYTMLTFDRTTTYDTILMQDKAIPMFIPFLKDDDIL